MSRKYIVGTIVIAQLIWGPIGNGWLCWLSLVGLPVAAWFLLGWTWRKWQPDTTTEDRIERALGSATGGVFAILAILEGIADSHLGNTMWVRTRDGMEAVGDDILLPGPDWGNVLMLLIVAGFAFWFSVAKKGPRAK